MSKSDPSDQSRINLFDDPKVIQQKVNKAMTDGVKGISYDVDQRPGVSNLINIYAAVTNLSVDEALKEMADLQNSQQLKQAVSDAIITRIQPIQAEYVKLQADPAYVQQVLKDGAAKAQITANQTIEQVYKLVGLD
jgi:tryptophanyl-tRNA synthetase